jgi:hypothetical protein
MTTLYRVTGEGKDNLTGEVDILGTSRKAGDTVNLDESEAAPLVEEGKLAEVKEPASVEENQERSKEEAELAEEGKQKYRVTGAYAISINDNEVKPGDIVILSEAEASHYITAGKLESLRSVAGEAPVPTKPTPSEVAAGGREEVAGESEAKDVSAPEDKREEPKE